MPVTCGDKTKSFALFKKQRTDVILLPGLYPKRISYQLTPPPPPPPPKKINYECPKNKKLNR